MPDPGLELKIGAPVEAIDGAFGSLHQVVLSPLDRRVVALIVRSGSLPPRDVVVPIAEVADATEQRVWLRRPAAAQRHADPARLGTAHRRAARVCGRRRGTTGGSSGRRSASERGRSGGSGD
jgi:hypothetical protein